MAFELLAKVADIRLHYVCFSSEVVVPDVVEYLGLGQHLSGVAQEEPEEIELCRCQLDELARSANHVRPLVHLDVGEGEKVGVAVSGPCSPQDRSHSGDYLREGKWLGHVVITAHAETGHFVLQSVPSCQEQNW